LLEYGACLYLFCLIVYKGGLPLNPIGFDFQFLGGLIMYYCNGYYFDQYQEARRYADFLLHHAGVYRAIFTRAEMEAHNLEGATI
jgi:hypothetical protein